MYKSCIRVLSALLFASAVLPALSQATSPVAGGGREGLPFRVGAGYSNYASDWNGRLGGPTVWAAFDVPKMPEDWSGLQIEVEGRDLNYNRTWGDQTLRQYTIAGGFNLAWRYDPAFHPYLKLLAGIGNENFCCHPNYRKDSRAFYAPAVGVDIRAHKRVWVRANYEYQFWPDMFIHHHTLNPNGVTVGLFYDFSKYAVVPYRGCCY